MTASEPQPPCHIHLPGGVEGCIAGHQCQHAIVRLEDGTKVGSDGVIQHAGNAAAGPTIIACKISHSGNNAITVDIDLIVG